MTARIQLGAPETEPHAQLFEVITISGARYYAESNDREAVRDLYNRDAEWLEDSQCYDLVKMVRKVPDKFHRRKRAQKVEPKPSLADLVAGILRPATVATYEDLHYMLAEGGHNYSRQAIAAAVKRDSRFKVRPGRRIKSDGTPYRNAGYVPATVQRVAEPIS